MDIRLGKKKAGAYLNDYDDESHWAVGLFDCLDTHLDAFLVSWACGVCVIATQKATLEGRTGCNIAQDCVPVTCCPLCCATLVRTQIRDRYGIEGSCISDALVSCLCSVCALTQQVQQMEHKGDRPDRKSVV